MTGTRTHLYQRGTFRKCRLTSSRLGFILIVLSFIWGMYLIQVQLNERQSQSEYLKEKIVALSKEYIDAVAKEKGLHSSELGTNGRWTSLPARALLIKAGALFRLQTDSRQALRLLHPETFGEVMLSSFIFVTEFHGFI